MIVTKGFNALIDQEHGQEREDYQQTSPRKFVVIRVLRAFKRQFHRYVAEAQKRDTDYNANERIMARWTRYVGIFTIVLAVVAVVSAVISFQALVVIQGQLNEMQASNREAKRLMDAAQKTAEAARDTVLISKETAEKQLRAYISVETIRIFKVKDKLLFFVYFRNAGQTPAYKVTTENHLFIGHFNSPIINIPNENSTPMIILGRGMMVPSVGVLDLTKHKDALTNPEAKVILYGKITYSDIFGELRTVRYKFRRESITGDVWGMEAAPEGNEAD